MRSNGGNVLSTTTATGDESSSISMAVREKSVSGAEIDDAAAAHQTPDSTRHLPGFVKLFAGQTPRAADGARQAMKERVVRKTTEIVLGQASAG